MSCTNLNVSKHIEAFLKFYNQARAEYTYCYNKVNECEKVECDLKHKLELGLYADRNEENRIKTQIKYILRDRRYYKDRVEELEPFMDLFENKCKEKENVSRACSSAINHISNCLGQVRKAEDYHRERTYKPRILKDTYGE